MDAPKTPRSPRPESVVPIPKLKIPSQGEALGDITNREVETVRNKGPRPNYHPRPLAQANTQDLYGRRLVEGQKNVKTKTSVIKKLDDIREKTGLDRAKAILDFGRNVVLKNDENRLDGPTINIILTDMQKFLSQDPNWEVQMDAFWLIDVLRNEGYLSKGHVEKFLENFEPMQVHDHRVEKNRQKLVNNLGFHSASPAFLPPQPPLVEPVANRRVPELERALVDAQKIVEQQRSQIEDLTQNNLAAKKSMARQEEKIAAQEGLKNTNDQYYQEISDQLTIIRGLKEQNTQTQQQLEEKDRRIETLSQEVNQKAAALVKLEADNLGLQHRLYQAGETVKRQDATITAQNEELKNLKTNQQSIEEKHTQAKKQTEEQTQQIKILSQDAAQKDAALKSLKLENGKLQKELAIAKQTITDRDDDLRRWSDDFDTLDDDFDTLYQENKKLKEELDTFKTFTKDFEKANEDLRKANEEKEKLVYRQVEVIDMAQRAIKARDYEIEERKVKELELFQANQQLTTQGNAIIQLNDENRKLEREQSRLSEDLKKANQAKQEALKENAEQKKVNETTLQKLQQVQSTLGELQKTMNNNIRKLNEEKQKLEIEKDEVSEELKKAKQIQQQTLQENLEQKKANESTLQQLQQVQNSLEEKQKEFAEKNNRLIQEKRQLETENKRNQEILKSQTTTQMLEGKTKLRDVSELNRLQQEVKELTEKLNAQNLALNDAIRHEQQAVSLNEKLNAEKQATASKSITKDRELQDKEGELILVKKQVADLEERLDDQKVDIESQASVILKLRKQIAEQRGQIDEAEAKQLALEELQMTNQQLKLELENTKARGTSATEQQQLREAQIAELQAKVAAQEAKLHTINQQFEATLEQRRVELEANFNNELAQRVAAREQELTTHAQATAQTFVNTQLTDLQTQNQAELSRLNEQNTLLKSQLDAKTRENAQKTQTIEELQNQARDLKNLQIQLTQQGRTIEAINNQLNQKNQDLQDQQTSIDQLQQIQAGLQNQSAILEQALQEKDQELQNALAANNQSQQQNILINTQLQDQAAQLEAFNNRLQEQNQSINQHQNELAQRDQQLGALTTTFVASAVSQSTKLQALGDFEASLEAADSALNVLGDVNTEETQKLKTNKISALIALGRYEEAVTLANSIINLVDDPNVKTAILGNIALAYKGIGNYHEAWKILGSLLDNLNSITNVVFQAVTISEAAYTLSELGQHQEALKLLDTLFPSIFNPLENSTKAEIIAIRAHILNGLMKYQEAFTLTEEALRNLQIDKTAKASLLLEQAKALDSLGRYHESGNKATEGLAALGTVKTPNLNAELILQQIQAHLDLGRNDAVIELTRRALSDSSILMNDEVKSSFYSLLSQAYTEIENYDQAMQVAQLGLGLPNISNATKANLLVTLSISLMTKNPDQAIAATTNALNLEGISNDKKAMLLAHLSNIYFQHSLYKEAFQYADMGLGLNPTNGAKATLLYAISQSLMNTNPADAYKAATTGLELNDITDNQKGNLIVMQSMALTHDQDNGLEKATQAIINGINNLGITDTKVKLDLYISLGAQFNAMKQYQLTLAAVAMAGTMKETNTAIDVFSVANLSYILSEAYLGLGNFSEAIKNAQAGLQANATDSTLNLNLYMTLIEASMKSGQYEGARIAATEAFQKFPKGDEYLLNEIKKLVQLQ